MKKFFKTLVISLILVLILMIIGYLTNIIFGYPIPSIYSSGGECVVYIGIGFFITRFYPLTNINQPYDGPEYEYNFTIITFLFGIVFFSLLINVITYFLDKRKKSIEDKKNKDCN